MTVLQLRVAIATAELQSVNAAAKFLNISQPNASNCLKTLEEEIGFPILLRTRTGTTVTHKGSEFLSHARRILEENDKIMLIRKADDVYRLHLGTANYYTAAEPFFTLCAEHRNDRNTDFRYFSVSILEGIAELVKRNLDIVAAPVMKHQITGLVSECEKNRIEMIPICEIPAVMMVRKDHPAASDNRCRNITQGCDIMKEYPYVGLRNLTEDSGSTGYNDSDFIQCSGKIFVDDTNVRLRTIEATNGFGFGILSSYKMMTHFGLIHFPVPGVSLKLFCLIHPGESGRREISDYLTLLRKEVDQLLS